MTDQNSNVLAQLSEQLAGAVERAGKSIVRVSGRPRHPASGLIWSGEGLIVTADHVLERDEDILVGLPDGQEAAATIVGRDPSTDLALLKVATQGLEPIETVDAVRVGALVLAVGRPGVEPSATFGVVSALGGPSRTRRGGMLDGFIRTDAVLYPGFSGGALVDASGRAIGLSTSHFGQGAGFALPVQTVRRVADALRQGGRVKRGYLGVTSQPVALPVSMQERTALQQETALLLLGVEPGGPADRAGVLVGDLLVALAGAPLRDTEDLQQALTSDRVGQSVPLRLLRGGQLVDVNVTVGERP